MAYIQRESRSQTSLFPVSLEELIPEDHLVRAIDQYVAKLDLGQLAFEKAQPKATGRPAYDPADQLKLYLYGYFQRIRSSRRHLNLNEFKRQEEKLDKRIAQYQADLDAADKAEGEQMVDRTAIKAALAKLEAKQQDNRSCQALMKSMGLEQFNTHESNVRMMRTPKGARVAYNVQTAVDAEHCLILHHEVMQDGDARKQLEPIAKAAKAELEQDTLTVTADMGYSNGQQFQACDEAAITVYVPPNRTSNPGGETLFEHQDFTYDAEKDRYQCPAGQWLNRSSVTKATGSTRRQSATALDVR
ncbi:hypothetical protein D3C75_403970 [compost metagenome]